LKLLILSSQLLIPIKTDYLVNFKIFCRSFKPIDLSVFAFINPDLFDYGIIAFIYLLNSSFQFLNLFVLFSKQILNSTILLHKLGSDRVYLLCQLTFKVVRYLFFDILERLSELNVKIRVNQLILLVEHVPQYINDTVTHHNLSHFVVESHKKYTFFFQILLF
jgi:hypothetical protein